MTILLVLVALAALIHAHDLWRRRAARREAVTATTLRQAGHRWPNSQTARKRERVGGEHDNAYDLQYIRTPLTFREELHEALTMHAA